MVNMSRNIIYLYIFLTTVVNINQTYSQQYWYTTNSPTNQTLKRLNFIDNLTGWAAGEGGVILHTSDGGEHWETQNSTVETNIEDIFFLDENKGWALTWTLTSPMGTAILKTEDGGENWTSEIYPESNKFMRKIFFIDSLNGCLGGEPDAFVYTINGGMEWNDVVIDSGGLGHLPVMNINFFNSNYGFAGGGAFDLAGVIWKTVNGGKNWYAMGACPEPVQDIIFFDSLNVLGVGGDFDFYGAVILGTYDAGVTWQYDTLGVLGVATAVSFRTPSEGWACMGSAEKFIVTSDSGLNWTPIATPDSSKIYDIIFTDSLHGYAVGDSGTILKYDTTIVGLPKLNPKISPLSFKLNQNYPNPFNPTTTISYRLTETSEVELTIYNITGQSIKRLVNEKQAVGDYQMQWNGRDETNIDVPSGVYFYQLIVGERAETKKMVLIR